MNSQPIAVAFDVIGTVFSLETLRDRLKSAGLPGETLETWFAQTLRDAFALELTEIYRPFREIASAVLTNLFAQRESGADAGTIDSILDGFAELTPYPDAVAAFGELREAGVRIVTLTNGSAGVTKQLLQLAALDHYGERSISIDEVRHWKPRREVYLHAAICVSVEPGMLALVAMHPWDIHGAGQAGLTTGCVARGSTFPTAMSQPDVTAETLAEVVAQLIKLG